MQQNVGNVALFVGWVYFQGMNEYKTGHIASWLNQHDNTIRDWSRRWKAHLSKGANAGRRRYTDSDIRVLATIANYRNQGLSLDAIDKLLNEGKLIPIDDIPKEPTPGSEAARQAMEIVEIPRDTYLLDVERYQLQIETYQTEITRLKTALDEAVEDKEELQSRLMEVTANYEAAKAQVTIIQQERRPAQYWLAIIAAITVAVVVIAAVAIVWLSNRGI